MVEVIPPSEMGWGSECASLRLEAGIPPDHISTPIRVETKVAGFFERRDLKFVSDLLSSHFAPTHVLLKRSFRRMGHSSRFPTMTQTG